jgi:hypothetical protein
VNQPEELNPSQALLPESEAVFERQLTQALRPVAAPAGFADRTMARLQSAAPVTAKVIAMQPRPHRLWTSGALAATLLIATVLTQQTHARHQRQQEAERAQQQFEAGLRITDTTLEHVRQQLQQAGLQIGN